jgi:hypothetical protein
MTDQEILLDYIEKEMGRPLPPFGEALLTNLCRVERTNEREACAVVAEMVVAHSPGGDVLAAYPLKRKIAEAIRSRKPETVSE